LAGAEKAEHPYPSIASLRAYEALEQDLAGVFNLYRPLSFTVAIDKRRLLAKDPGGSALGWAYAFLYRRIALKLEQAFPGEGGVLVADRQKEHERYFESGELTGFRDRLAATSRLKAEYQMLLDRPIWIDTELSTWDREIIQLADLVAFATHELVEQRGILSTTDQALWVAIRNTLSVSVRGEPDGEGLVIFPMPEPGTWPITS
jgi:hypothetical protein